MNTSQFMDKQILGLAGSQSQSIGSTSGGELFDLMTPGEDCQRNGDGTGKNVTEDIVPSYDFQPIRAVGSSSPPNSSGGGGTLDGSRFPAISSSWGASMDSKLASSILKISLAANRGCSYFVQ